VLEVEATHTTERQVWGCWRAGDGGVLMARGGGIGYAEGVEAAGGDPQKRSGCRGSPPEGLGAAELGLWAAPWGGLPLVGMEPSSAVMGCGQRNKSYLG